MRSVEKLENLGSVPLLDRFSDPLNSTRKLWCHYLPMSVKQSSTLLLPSEVQECVTLLWRGLYPQTVVDAMLAADTSDAVARRCWKGSFVCRIELDW